MTQRAYKLRFYPTHAQERALAQWFGHCRWAWNWALDARGKAYARRGETLTSIDLSRRVTQLKQMPSFGWLAEVPADCLNQKLRDLDTAFQNFFAGRARYPRFKSRRGPQSVRVCIDARHGGKVRAWTAGTNERPQRHLVLPQLGAVKLRGYNLPSQMPKMATVSRDAAGRYWVSFSVEGAIPEAPPPVRSSIGVDAGARRLATLSTGERIENPRSLRRYAAQMKHLQQRLARQCKGSNRRKKTRHRIARCHARIADCRREHLHRVTTRIVHESQVICVETLDVKGMTQSARGSRARPAKGVKRKTRINRALLDASMGELLRQLEYKSEWYGRTLVKVDLDFPSSGLCSVCHEVNEDLTLDDTKWTCPSCGTHHDRDDNAATNIEAEGLRILKHPEDTGGVRG